MLGNVLGKAQLIILSNQPFPALLSLPSYAGGGKKKKKKIYTVPALKLSPTGKALDRERVSTPFNIQQSIVVSLHDRRA